MGFRDTPQSAESRKLRPGDRNVKARWIGPDELGPPPQEKLACAWFADQRGKVPTLNT